MSGHTGKHPAFPAQWFYGLCRTLPGDRAFLSPSSLRSLLLKNLTPASRRQDHTILPSARSALSSLALLASIASRSNVRDDRETPLSVGRDGGRYKLICVFGKSEYFFKEGWTDDSVICPSGGGIANAHWTADSQTRTLERDIRSLRSELCRQPK